MTEGGVIQLWDVCVCVWVGGCSLCRKAGREEDEVTRLNSPSGEVQRCLIVVVFP